MCWHSVKCLRPADYSAPNPAKGVSTFYGIFFRNTRSKTPPLVLDAMRKAVQHRFYDQDTVWAEASAAMGQCTLRITPESFFETFPFTNNRDSLVLSGDIRLDNRQELLKDLGLNAGEKIGDGEIILSAYRRWGEHCPDRFVGDFVVKTVIDKFDAIGHQFIGIIINRAGYEKEGYYKYLYAARYKKYYQHQEAAVRKAKTPIA